MAGQNSIIVLTEVTLIQYKTKPPKFSFFYFSSSLLLETPSSNSQLDKFIHKNVNINEPKAFIVQEWRFYSHLRSGRKLQQNILFKIQ